MKTYMFCAAFVQVYFSIIHLQRAAQNIANQCICPVHLMTAALSLNNYISCKAGRSVCTEQDLAYLVAIIPIINKQSNRTPRCS